MARSQTARLELNNPYAKYGLKRKPTFNEIVGLVSENENLLKPFPDRRATQFRNSPQGSFFDGSDHIELLKEQQGRIHDRQIREFIMRRQMQGNGRTLHVEQHLENTSGTSTPIMSEPIFDTPSDVSSSRMMYNADVERRVQERLGGIQQRQQEVRQAFGDQLRASSETLTQRMLPQQRPEIHSMSSDEELVEDIQGQLAPQTSSQTPPSLPAPPSMYLRQIVYSDTIGTWMRRNVKELQTQMFLRDIEYQSEEEFNDISHSSSSARKSYKQYLLDIVVENIRNGNWMRKVSKEIEEERQTALKGSGKGVLRKAFDAGVSSAVDVGKGVVRELGKGATDALIGRFVP